MRITLNLLPEGQKAHLKKKRLFGIVLQQELYVFFLMTFAIGILLTILLILNNRITLNQQITEIEQRQESVQSLKTYENLFAQTNDRLRTVEEAAGKHLYWSRIFVTLDAILIDGVLLSSLETTEQKITIRGVARDRDVLKRQREVLTGYKDDDHHCFENVDAPNEDIFQKEDINFTITFDVAQSCLTT